MKTLEEVAERQAMTACWRALTLLAETVRRHGPPPSRCSLLIGDTPAVCLDSLRPPEGDGWRVSLVLDGDSARNCPLPAEGEIRYRLENLIVLRRTSEDTLPRAAAALLELYLPYCMAPLHARRAQRSFTVSHFAQSLDGRVATDFGDSRQIGVDIAKTIAGVAPDLRNGSGSKSICRSCEQNVESAIIVIIAPRHTTS